MTTVDDYTGYVWSAGLSSKDLATDVLIAWHRQMLTQYPNIPLRRICTDNGGEFVNNKMQDFCREFGVVHETSIPHTVHLNRMA